MISYEFDDYDITMCNDGFCSKKEQCHRYLTYQEYKQDKSEDKPTLVSLKADGKRPFGGCSLYWEERDRKS